MARFRASRFTRTARPTRATRPKKAAPEPEETAETPAASASSGGRGSGIPRGKPLAQEEPPTAATRPYAAQARARSAPEPEPSRTSEPAGQADAARGYRAEDFTSRAEAAGATTFADASSTAPAGADQLPGAFQDAVAGNLGGEEATLIDPSKLAGEGRQMPAGAPTAEASAQTADLRGMADRADQTTSMADNAGISKDDDATASAANTQTEDSGTAREYLSGNSDGAGQSLDVDNMSDAEVTEAAAVEADYEVGVGPARDYLKGGSDRTGQTPDVDRMTNEEVLDEVDKEAESRLLSGANSGPSYVDADGGGAFDSATAAQVAADEKQLGARFDVDNPSTPGNIDPNEFGTGAEESRDTSILDMSDPGSVDAADSFGSGTMGSGPPPKADIDYGEDYVDTNPAAGPYDDVGGISQAPADDTIDFDPPDEAGALSFTEASTPDISSAFGDLTDVVEDEIDDFDL